MTDKLPYIIGIGVFAILLIFAVQSTGLFGLAPASLISITPEVKELNGMSYIYIVVDEKVYDNQEIGTIKTGNIPIKDAINSKGETIEGTFDAVFKVKILNTGWEAPVTQLSTSNFINSAWMESTWLAKTVKYTYDNPIIYNQVSGDLSPVAIYQITATINGETYTEIIDKNNKGLVTMVDTTPKIYWDEISYGLDAGSKIPAGISNVDIVLDSNRKLYFLNKGMTKEAVLFWNAIFEDDTYTIQSNEKLWGVPHTIEWHAKINRRIDLDTDNVYDIKDITLERFSVNNLLSNTYRFKTSDSAASWGAFEGVWIDFPSGNKVPFKSIKSTSGYVIASEDADTIKREGELSIQGVWRIPVEYGDVYVKTSYPKPEIVNVPKFSETLYKDTTASVIVSVKNNGDSGEIVVSATSNEQIELPESVTKSVPAGETVDFELIFKTTTITSGDITINAQGGGVRDSVSLAFDVKDASALTKHRIIITSVNEDGIELGTDFPITVSYNSVTRYGTWIGDLPVGKTKVSGEELVHDDVRYYPNDFTYDVTKDDSTTLVYTTTPPKDEETPWYYYLIGIVISIIILMFVWRRINE